MREFEPYEQIWEQNGKWDHGRKILQRTVDSVRGRGLIASTDPEDPSTVQIRLPLPHTTLGVTPVLVLFLDVPEKLTEILKDRLAMILRVNRIIWITNTVFRQYEGTRVNSRVIPQMNNAFQRYEDLSASYREPTLADIISHYFGLWPARHDVSSITAHQVMGG